MPRVMTSLLLRTSLPLSRGFNYSTSPPTWRAPTWDRSLLGSITRLKKALPLFPSPPLPLLFLPPSQLPSPVLEPPPVPAADPGPPAPAPITIPAVWRVKPLAALSWASPLSWATSCCNSDLCVQHGPIMDTPQYRLHNQLHSLIPHHHSLIHTRVMGQARVRRGGEYAMCE